MATLESWSRARDALWGPYQRFQLDHFATLRDAYRKGGLLSRDSGFLIIETIAVNRTIGFVRYTFLRVPDSDFPHPEIGFGIGDPAWRGKGLAREAVGLLVAYLFSGHASPMNAAFTEAENAPARRLLEGLGFRLEGMLRRATFRDGEWRDIAAYGLLRDEWSPRKDS